MPTLDRSKRRFPTLNKRAAAVSALLAALSPIPLFAGGVYAPFNVDFPNGVAQPSRSGPIALVDRFNSPDAWSEIGNYRDALSVEVGAEFEGAPALVVARKTTNPDDPEDADTAWNATSVRRPLPEGASGGEFVVRVAARASKTALAGTDDATWKGCAVLWFDADGEPCGETPFLFAAGVGDFFGSRAFSGRVPNDAAAFAIRLGFDIPDLALGDWVAIRSVEFETPVDSDAPFRRSGEFVSEIFPGRGARVSWDADAPAGTVVRFQIATAPEIPDSPQSSQLPQIPGDFGEFVGPDGTAATFFKSPFAVDAPFFRYKATLVPTADGTAVPTLRSVLIGDRVDDRFRVGGDDQAPKVSVVGRFAAPSRDASAAVELRLDDASPLRWSTLRVAVDETEIADFAQPSQAPQLNANSADAAATAPRLSVDFAASRLSLTPPENAPWSPGLHSVRVEIADVGGNTVAARKFFFVGDAPTTPRYTLRDDGTTLIDGVPFFPIGVYGVSPYPSNGFDLDKAFADLKAAGFNFAQSYFDGRTDAFLQAAEKRGFKLWVGVDGPDERLLDVERHSPAILAWYVGDDTAMYFTPEELRDRSDSLRAVDPTRLSTQADVVAAPEVSSYLLYADGTDAFLPEIYPFRRDEPEWGERSVAATLRDMRICRRDAALAGDGPKAIWPILQSFKGWGWTRFPTFRELNATSFAALAAGANGIVWYTYGDQVEPERNLPNYGSCANPEVWANLTTVSKRIASLQTVLVERTRPELQPSTTVLSGPKLDPLGGPSIVSLLKISGGEVTVIAVNASPKPVEVRFDFSATAPSDAKIPGERLFEDDATATLDAGFLVDRFEGFDVRVYRWPAPPTLAAE
ncbi:MAG: hypothetical protein IKU86_08180 [Thermoguttaceae bacterium]|nr:hypothetical protein [Thermoguttaceae bacterium]